MTETSPAEEIFFAALAKATPAQQAAYLDVACAGQPDLRVRVEKLLAAHPRAGGFLEPEAANIKTGAFAAGKPASPDDPSAIEGTIVAGKYKLLQQIGEGGMGSVWMADQTEPVKRRVAVKLIRVERGSSKMILSRFEAERQAIALMDHPHIARLLDAGTTDAGQPYFVMELVKGIPLTEYCDAHKLSIPERLGLFQQICSAVQHAHQKGIIHRDLKPTNILVESHDGKPVPKVIDFGLAKATSGMQLTDRTLFTAFGNVMGTPTYMAPEQATFNAVDVDTRADVYSLGVILYELLTGTTPITRETVKKAALDEVLKLVREQEAPRPSSRLSTAGTVPAIAANRNIDPAKLSKLLRGDLDWVVLKALEKDRTRRYETANGLAADIRRHLSNEPVVARPPSAAYRFQKAWLRNKLAFTAAAAVALALIGGIAASTWQAARAQRAKTQAVLAHADAVAAKAKAEAAQSVAETEQVRADAHARKASESQQQSRRLLYAADMNLAQQSLKLNNLGRARRLLDRYRPLPSEEDLRGWEWRYLWQLTRSSALVTLANRPVRGFSVSFSSDGTRLAVGWHDGRVELWDVPTRRLIRALTDRDDRNRYPARVAFSPVRNLLVATVAVGVNGVTLFDLDSGQETILWRAPEPGRWGVHDLAFSQDGSQVVIYASRSSAVATPDPADEAWVVNVSSAQTESHHSTGCNCGRPNFGCARLSPDGRRLYLPRSDHANNRYSIQCIDLATGQELWQTGIERDRGMTALAISLDGRVLASGSGYEDPTIRIWDAETGRQLFRLDGHTSFVYDLAFTKDGRRLVSAAADQSIRFWDTSNWTETQVLRGHTDEIIAVAISESARLVASGSKDGNIMLWKADGTSAADGYRRLPEDLLDNLVRPLENQIRPLDQSRFLLRSLGKPALVDLKSDSAPVSMPKFGSATEVLVWSEAHVVCHRNEANQIIVRELRGTEFIERGAFSLNSEVRPRFVTYNATRHLLAWSEGPSSSVSVHLASLAAPDRRMELTSDVPGLFPIRFSDDGTYLVARGRAGLRVWNIATGQIVASYAEAASVKTFAAGGQIMIVDIFKGNDHEIAFFDLAHPDRAPRRVSGRFFTTSLAVSPNGGLVALSTEGGVVRLFDAINGELIEDLHGHLNGAHSVAFSPDGRRLISASGGREAVKLWDVGTRQELLTLAGAGSTLYGAGWSADGDAILVGSPWQAWTAPSWEEIAAAEARLEASGRK